MRVLHLLLLIPIFLVTACDVTTKPDQVTRPEFNAPSAPPHFSESVVEFHHSLAEQAVVELVQAIEPAEPLSIAWLEGTAKKRARLAQLEQSQRAPQLQLHDWINSEPLTLQSLKGKIVVIDFWATWCDPCMDAMPHTIELYEKFKDDGVVVIGVCAENGAKRMKKVAKRYKIPFPVAADVNERTFAAYRADGRPDYYVIDRLGRLRAADCRTVSLELVITKLLSE